MSNPVGKAMTKRAALVVIAGCSILAAESPSASPPTDRKAVLGTVQLLLDGGRDSDAAKAERALHPQFREVTCIGSTGCGSCRWSSARRWSD